MFGPRFKKEQKLIEDALLSEQGEKTLRAYVRPTVQSCIDEFVIEQNIKTDKEVLMLEAWKYFSLAVEKYSIRSKRMMEGKEELYYFETYYRWFVRQALHEYTESSQKNSGYHK